MKLSEMSNKDAIKATVKLLPVIKVIVNDKELLNIWYRDIELKVGMTENDIKIEKGLYVTNKIIDLVPYVLEKHDKEIYKIISILNNKTVKEVENQKFLDTITEITDILNDEALKRLFTM